jgi:hypothetical protein
MLIFDDKLPLMGFESELLELCEKFLRLGHVSLSDEHPSSLEKKIKINCIGLARGAKEKEQRENLRVFRFFCLLFISYSGENLTSIYHPSIPMIKRLSS